MVTEVHGALLAALQGVLAGLLVCPPPVSGPIHRRTDLVQKPFWTLMGFKVAKFLGHERAKLDTPFVECLMADPHAALLQHLLHVLRAAKCPYRRAQARLF